MATRTAKAAQSTTTQVPLHPNPKIAKALAENARNGDKYDSAAALCRAVGIMDMPTQRSVRQILRDAGQGVGRGNRYKGITAPRVVKAQAANAKRSKAQVTKAASGPEPVEVIVDGDNALTVE